MSWLAATTTGFGLGLVSFGVLWLTVRQLLRGAQWKILMIASGLTRLSLVGLTFYALSREGPDKLLAGLAGLWLARCCLIRRLGGLPHGR
ncbi:MAG TPA: ATP synthase subunit I [Gemmataceae bacterium]|nr:ATP synthase subunit I [Gemmataceae bacterium]